MHRQHRILLFLVFFVSSQLRAQSKAKLLHTLFDSLGKAHAFNGAVLVADSGKIILEKGYGYADFESKIPMTTDTRFEIASVSKQFTALAIMQLHHQGKLDYDDRVTKYLPRLPYKNVTIRDLTDHASGIVDFLGWTAEQMGMAKDSYTNEDIERHLCASAPDTHFEPGTRFSYSNTNYLLLADIVARVSGVPFADYMQRHIFRKAGMHQSSIPVFKDSRFEPPAGNIARNYMFDPVTNSYRLFSKSAPVDYQRFMGGICGPAGIKSTVGDLYKWTQALRSNILVPDSIFAAAVRPQLTKDGKDTLGYDHMAYSFGWLITHQGKQTYIWHNGGFGGYRSIIAFYPNINRSIIILENTNQTVSPDQLCVSIMQIMNGASSIQWPSLRKIPSTIRVDSIYLEKLTGTYCMSTDPKIKMVITTRSGRLYARYLDQPVAELYPCARDNFFFLIADAQVKFRKKEDRYVELVLVQNGRELPMTRRRNH